MKNIGNFTCENSISFLNSTMLLMNCYLIKELDIFNPKLKPCTDLCLEHDTSIPTIREWNKLTKSDLYTFCKDTRNCDFAIKLAFNFVDSYWESDGEKLENITWKSASYPLLNDILTICGYELDRYRLGFPFNDVRFCVKSSTKFNLNRTDYLGYHIDRYKPTQRSNTLDFYENHGYFFCHDEELELENLKRATLNEAKKTCSRIKTPNVCFNRTLRKSLIDLISWAELKNPG